MLARDIDTRSDLDAKRDEWFQEFRDVKDDVERHCEYIRRVSGNGWILKLNTGLAYIYKPAQRKMRTFNSDKVFFVAADVLVNFILQRERKAVNKILAARAKREKYDKRKMRNEGVCNDQD